MDGNGLLFCRNSYFRGLRCVIEILNGGAVEDRTPVRNHATPNLYMFREVVCFLVLLHTTCKATPDEPLGFVLHPRQTQSISA